ncbi:MAG: hypothetical protein GEU80_11530 [Dehalococcoidia bacterium]|nr:hypothetical protein [Dehalococcoidia bacterium]
MPLYEFYCDDCRGVFELIRPVREAGRAQPCPDCDADSRPLMPTEFQAFIARDGVPRRLPDRGRYWHYDQEVSTPITTAAVPGEHPEVRRKKVRPDQPPTVEEFEAFEDRLQHRLEEEAESVASGHPPIRDAYQEHQARQFLDRAAKTAPQAKRQKRRAPNAKTTAHTRSRQRGGESTQAPDAGD